jgi:CheY-like chemotaxis protein
VNETAADGRAENPSAAPAAHGEMRLDLIQEMCVVTEYLLVPIVTKIEPKSSSVRTALVIEDNQAIRESIQMALELEGIDVVVAENGKAGLAALNRINNPGIIFLDLMMPIMNGFQFMDHLRDHPRAPAIPIVVISAFPDTVFSVPVEAKLMKPLSLDDLLAYAFKYCK